MGGVCNNDYENFLFGYGLSGTDLVTFQYFGYGGETPHNIILQILIYAGIPGLIFFLFISFPYFKASYITYKNSGILLPALLASPLLGYFMLTQSISEKIVWIMMAYIVGNYLVNNLKISPFKGFMKILIVIDTLGSGGAQKLKVKTCKRIKEKRL